MAGLNVLALNAGSSSLKASLFALDSTGLEGGAPTGLRWQVEGAKDAGSLASLLAPLWSGSAAPLASRDDVDAVGHRVVHGGATLRESRRISPDVRTEIARVAEYAPAHNAAALELIDEAALLFGDGVPQVAVFDTAFHRSMAPEAFAYAGPHEWIEQDIIRFGFHGINHRYAAHRAALLLGFGQDGSRIVTCHLGSGCSLAAVRDGRSIDTTMGFTPLDGLPMARRSGSIDPGIVLHLLRHGGHTVDSLEHLLNEESGLAGLSGTDGDMRTVLRGLDRGDPRCRLAFDVFVHRLGRGIASMAAAMNGVDAIVFTGGIGEHAPRVRAAAIERLRFLGAAIDAERNDAITGEGVVSSDGSQVRVIVVPAQENWMIARECVRLAGQAVE